MKIHEYQGKALFRAAGVPVPKGFPAFSVKECVEGAAKLQTNKIVVKAQIHAGGRGKGGGVKIVSPANVQEAAEALLGMTLVTHQTGPEGKLVQRLLVEEASDIARELYAGIVLDRSTSQFAFMVSTEGGMEIEKVASETPEKIIKEWITPGQDLKVYQARKLAFSLGLTGVQVKYAVKTFMALWQVFKQYDCSLIEINPLVVTRSDEIIALDSKINFDDNALFRHPDILELRDLSEEETSEIEASRYHLNYIKLEGDVGCMVNGAGLAMATMDIIKHCGGEPANFLDVGGVANAETVAHGFNIILSDKNVKAILINIFGGIVRCDRVAQGVIDAMGQLKVNVPVVVRLEGTNAVQAGEMLENSPLEFIVAKNLEDAAEKVVLASKGGK
ncbi:MAG: ADP-forming succinate--CoA ligase subunit beta [FCB group bacterium]|nr:ADP-forming succinate--CoA ligase subunit beta [FCB group bacterium]